jgi:hypothetical protein
VRQTFHPPAGLSLAEKHARLTDRSGGPDACWPWIGALNRKGYGIFGVNKVGKIAHRCAYEFAVGPIPDGLYVLHSCDNRRCQNPAHLRAGDQLANMRDMAERGRANKVRGPQHGMAKLNEAIVRDIRSSADNRADLARRYGVAWETVDAIVKGQTWAHVK